jgi:hypothetical protein
MVDLSLGRSPFFFSRFRQLRDRPLTLLGLTVILLGRGCSYDWDAYDPRLGGGSGSGGAGGTGTAQTGGGPCSPKASRPCYTGPPDSKGVGVCKEGAQVCNAEGTGWGPCQLEVTPVSDDCGAPADEDCNGTPNDHCSLWSMRVGGSGDQSPYGMAVDASGAVIIAGSSLGKPSFGGASFETLGEGDLFIAKYDTSGAHVWSKVFGDAEAQQGRAVAVDSAGNVFVTGFFSGTLSFSAGLTLTSAGLEDIFLVKLDPSGNVLWAKGFGDGDSQLGNAVAVDAAGNVYVAGSFEGTVDFGGGPVLADDEDGVLIKLDPSGIILWSFTFGGSGDDSADSVAIDPGGDVLLGGKFHYKVSIGGTPLDSNGGADMVAVKLTAAGSPAWVKGFGSSESDYVGGIASDATGNVILAGLFGDSIDFGCGALEDQGPADLFVAKLNPAGGCLWSKGFGEPNGQEDPRVAVDGAGNVLVTDEFVGTIDFGGAPVVTAEPTDILVLKLDPSGNHLWSRRFGDDSDQDGRAIATDSANNVYVLGELSGTINFGNGLLTSSGSDDVCLAKLGP